jgi:hypothetical protein
MLILQEVLSDLEPFRITWDYKQPETEKIKTDKKTPKSKIMALLKAMNFAYGMGAAVVIVGALFKITHFEFGPLLERML